MENIFNDKDFESEVLKSEIPVLIDFWAEWCGPCRIQGPIIEQLSHELDASKIKIGKMNADDNPDTPRAYGIMSIPTLIIFKNGSPVEHLVGLRSKEVLKKVIEKHIQ